MSLSISIANRLWAASNRPAHRKLLRALSDPQAAQALRLKSCLARGARSAFGREHGLEDNQTHSAFARRVPLSDYDALEPWIDRIRGGERRVLTSETVTRLVPTSGSSGARKLIPFTAGLQREFQAGLGAWLTDLNHRFPGLADGRAYWSVTPALEIPAEIESAVPVGFDSDAEYLGGVRRRLAERILAVPPRVQRASSLDEFHRETLVHLLACGDLRLISVWHPSFLMLLMDELASRWEALLAEASAKLGRTARGRRRAEALRDADPSQPRSLWRDLRLISCWAGGAAQLGVAELQRRFPGVHVQPKGLLATEAMVTLPFQDQYPLAVTSHFFEFLDDSGRVVPVQDTRVGGEYKMVVTTAGGLWRYRLGDRVRVTGLMGATPTLEFLGRGQSVSDLRGEKLCEPFVAAALQKVFGAEPPRFALLAPEEDGAGWRYTLHVEGGVRAEWAERLDGELRENPHYAYCRDLGQLRPVRVAMIPRNGYELYARHCAAAGVRLGDIKPAALSNVPGWSRIFTESRSGAP